MQITKKPLLRIEAFQEKRGIRLEGRGPAAPLARPILERMNRIFADEKPIISSP
ncbi:MAG: hypothetical protein LUQ15_02195 [Methanothrix sp.]|nr:hypothetical protein [Methanothrix sp.]OYV09427.1 MAG: radical SAM domain-containing protein [Methanosaeta sp. NSP1]